MRSRYAVIFVLSIVYFACQAQGPSQPDAKNGVEYDTAKFQSVIRKARPLVYHYPDSALQYLDQVITLPKGLVSPKQLAEAKSWAGVAHYVKGEYDHALPLFTEALRHYTEMNDDHGLSGSFNHIGLILQTQKRYAEAIAYHRKGVSHSRAAGSADREAINHFNIGLAYDEIGSYDSALYYLQRCLSQSREIGLHRMIIMSFNRLGKVYFHLGEHATAEALYDSVLSYQHYQNNWEKCFALAGLAEVYDKRGLSEKAVSAGLESLRLAKEIDAKWDIIHAAEILSRAYARKNDYERAYEVSTMMQAYKDSVFNEEKENKLNYIHLKENELAKAQLEKKNALQSTRLREKNFQIALALILSISLAIILIVVYRIQRHKSRLNRRLTAINQKIEQQVIELNEINQAKNKLFSIISHDLRSPFSHLEGLLTLNSTGLLSEKERDELFKQLEHSFRSVSGTLDSLLQWANSQMEGLKTNPERLDVDAIIKTTKTFWEPTISSKGIIYSHKTNGYEVYADRYQLKTVIRNVLGNAVKFTPPSGAIYIDTVHREGKIGIMIKDTGVGIPQAMRDSLFTFQKKNQRPGTSNEKGTGLGLMISHQLLEKNNGTIEVESEEGKGTVFTLWVPAA